MKNQNKYLKSLLLTILTLLFVQEVSAQENNSYYYFADTLGGYASVYYMEMTFLGGSSKSLGINIITQNGSVIYTIAQQNSIEKEMQWYQSEDFLLAGVKADMSELYVQHVGQFSSCSKRDYDEGTKHMVTLFASIISYSLSFSTYGSYPTIIYNATTQQMTTLSASVSQGNYYSPNQMQQVCYLCHGTGVYEYIRYSSTTLSRPWRCHICRQSFYSMHFHRREQCPACHGRGYY